MARDMAQMEAVHPDGARTGATVQLQPELPGQRVGRASHRTPHRKTLTSYPEAKTWRDDVRVAIRAGTIRKPRSRRSWKRPSCCWRACATARGSSRSGRDYKPSTCRSYSQAVRSTSSRTRSRACA